MQPIISGREGGRIKIEVTIDLSGSMLEATRNGIRRANYRRLTTRRTGSSGMFISVPKAAKPFARWMMGQGLSGKRRLAGRIDLPAYDR
jgi:hypothetical protein